MHHLLSRLLLLTLFVSCQSFAAEEETLTRLLNEFLAGNKISDYKNHDRFWADDLVYTSSSGKRFGKSHILAQVKESEGEKSPTDYRAEQVNIKRYGTTAIIAFRLVAETKEKDKIVLDEYFNTGTFLKREGKWQAVAWQATKIPPEVKAGDKK